MNPIVWVMDQCRKANRIRREWSTFTTLRKFEFWYNLADLAAGCIGLRFLRGEKVHFSAYGFCLLFISYFVLAIYTFTYNAINGSIIDAVPSLSLSGMYISSFIGYYVASFGDPEKFRTSVDFGRSIYNDDRRPTQSNLIREKNMRVITKFILWSSLLVYGSLIVGVSYPAYIFYREGIFYSLTGVSFPFVESGTKYETIINVIYQIFVGYSALIGLIVLQIDSGLVSDARRITTDLTICEIDQLSDELERNRLTRSEIRFRLRRIFMQIQKGEEYVTGIGDVFYWYFFLSPMFLTYSIGISIYSQYMLGVPTGYGIAVMSYVQMITMCLIGHIIVLQGEKLTFGLYNMKWYLLPIEHQLDVYQMINRMQNGAVLTIGPFDVMNFEIVKVLTQSIHSFLMLLINFNG